MCTSFHEPITAHDMLSAHRPLPGLFEGCEPESQLAQRTSVPAFWYQHVYHSDRNRSPHAERAQRYSTAAGTATVLADPQYVPALPVKSFNFNLKRYRRGRSPGLTTASGVTTLIGSASARSALPAARHGTPLYTLLQAQVPPLERGRLLLAPPASSGLLDRGPSYNKM